MKSELLTKKQLSLELYDKFGQYPIFRKWGKEGRHVRAEVPKFEGITRGRDALRCMAIPGFLGWACGPVYEVSS